MAAFGRPHSIRPSRSTVPLLVFILWFAFSPAAVGQEPATVAATDSASAVATACRILLAIPPSTPSNRCVVERYEETPTEYVLRIRELPPPGGKPSVFSRSEVRLSKQEPSVTVKREPGL